MYPWNDPSISLVMLEVRHFDVLLIPRRMASIQVPPLTFKISPSKSITIANPWITLQKLNGMYQVVPPSFHVLQMMTRPWITRKINPVVVLVLRLKRMLLKGLRQKKVLKVSHCPSCPDHRDPGLCMHEQRRKDGILVRSLIISSNPN